MKTVVTVTGIRPDFIRMSSVFELLDKEPNIRHIMIHTGQHFDRLLSDVFFDELNLRTPDYNLEIGGPGKEHFHQSADLSVKIIELFREENIHPDLVVFLGDSNSVTSAVALKKEGYKICHIEAGMRSGDKRMLEEINRIVCDHCSDLLFVYHENYAKKLAKEGITSNVFVVGNTITDPIERYYVSNPQDNTEVDPNLILIDIHRPENFKDTSRLQKIFNFANYVATFLKCKDIRVLSFPRTVAVIESAGIDIGNATFCDLMPFKQYLDTVRTCKLLISDSGTAQEEAPLLGVPCIVPRDFTERPESHVSGCSFMLELDNPVSHGCAIDYACNAPWKFIDWLYNQPLNDTTPRTTTARQIVDGIKMFLKI